MQVLVRFKTTRIKYASTKKEVEETIDDGIGVAHCNSGEEHCSKENSGIKEAGSNQYFCPKWVAVQYYKVKHVENVVDQVDNSRRSSTFEFNSPSKWHLENIFGQGS